MKQLRAEYYKLKYSRSTIWVAVFMFVMLMMPFIVGNDTLFMTFGDYQNIDSIGWICYVADVHNARFEEIARFALSVNFFMWIGLSVYITTMLSKEYQTGTLKLPVLYGTSKMKVLLDKLIVLNAYFFSLYFIVEMILAFSLGSKYGFHFELNQIFTFIGVILLNAMAMIGLEFFAVILTIIFKNSGIVTTAVCVWFFAGAITYPMVYENMEIRSLPIKIFCAINPTTYMYNICGYRMTLSVIQGTIIFFLCCCVIGILLMYLLLRKQEF